ncbi:corticoliberin-1-like [Sander lucioperca]|uniref:corticoliberin-1-like n=1 Tax=Sander lucioperca TaxID=283035 RepID=UPI0016536B7E|nr:corticoliberin-1-like [Sander lucioperca]
MKLNVLLGVGALLAVFLPRSADCRPADADAAVATATGQRRLPLMLPRPLLLHLGEEFSLRLGGGSAASSPSIPPSSSSSFSSSAVNVALLRLTQRLLQVRAEQQTRAEQQEEEKEKRSEEPPISLDLTFHLLREVLQMARAEQQAQQADSNRRMMDTAGK